LATALIEFEKEKRAYYSHRYRELKRLGLREAAEKTAILFANGEETRNDLEVEAEAGEALDGLLKAGFIWTRPEEVDYEPGIPSLMDFVRSRTRA